LTILLQHIRESQPAATQSTGGVTMCCSLIIALLPLCPRRPLRLIINADQENRRGRRGRRVAAWPATY